MQRRHRYAYNTRVTITIDARLPSVQKNKEQATKVSVSFCIRFLSTYGFTSKDAIVVIAGPGPYTQIRRISTAATMAAHLTGCQLLSSTNGKLKKVSYIEPIYLAPSV